MDTVIEFETIKDQINISYINNLIKVCDKNNINKDELYKKIKELENKTMTEANEAKLIKNKSNLSLSNLTNTDSPTAPPTPTYNDDYLYQKPWTKLTAIHKIIKIKEFVNKLLINDEEEKQILKDKLVEMVKNKSLTKKESVNYDPVKSKVVSITKLKYENGKYLI
jgi:hypothetical protein